MNLSLMPRSPTVYRTAVVSFKVAMQTRTAMQGNTPRRVAEPFTLRPKRKKSFSCPWWHWSLVVPHCWVWYSTLSSTNDELMLATPVFLVAEVPRRLADNKNRCCSSKRDILFTWILLRLNEESISCIYFSWIAFFLLTFTLEVYHMICNQRFDRLRFSIVLYHTVFHVLIFAFSMFMCGISLVLSIIK